MQTATEYADSIADHDGVPLVRTFAPSSWPPSLERVHAAVAREPMDIDEVVRLIGSDARLVLRVFAVTNSSFFDAAGRPVTELRVAVRRLGVPGLRCVLVATALALWRNAPRLFHLHREMMQLRQHGSAVAAAAWCIARASGGCGEADALLAGLMYNAGKLALLTELDQSAVSGDARRQQLLLVAKWHARLGANIATQWQLPSEVSGALLAQERVSRQKLHADPEAEVALLGSVLTAALEVVRTAHAAAATAEHLAQCSPLPLDVAQWQSVIGQLPSRIGAADVAFGD